MCEGRVDGVTTRWGECGKVLRRHKEGLVRNLVEPTCDRGKANAREDVDIVRLADWVRRTTSGDGRKR